MFDNAADMASVAAFLPPAGPGRVLITSQNPNWPPGQALDVPVLDHKVAAGFLVNRTGDPDLRAALELAGEVGGLPLALEQAAAYMVAAGDRLAGYLALFRQRRPDLLSRGEPTGHPDTVVTTLALAFGRLEESAPGAAGLLQLLASCAPEPIPLRLLLQPRPALAGQLSRHVAGMLMPLLEDELAAKDAIAALRRYSLLSSADGGSVLVHRLVQAVTADQMPEELRAAWRAAAAAVIEAALPDNLEQPDTWLDFAALLPHAQTALTADSEGMGRIALYLVQSGSFIAGRQLSRRVLETRGRVLGPEHPDTLAARANFAISTGAAGDAAEARDQLAALLPMAERVLGPEHPATLAYGVNLARWTAEGGDPTGARDLSAALLPVAERVFGPEHAITLAVAASLTLWTGAAGDVAGARDQYAALLPVLERLSGPGHPIMLATDASLADSTGLAGDADGARDQYAALLSVRERVSGPEHLETLITAASLALWTGLAGDPVGARDQSAALLATAERVFGREHAITLAAAVSLARWTGEAGDTAAARDQYAALLPVYEQVLGPSTGHPVRPQQPRPLDRAGGGCGRGPRPVRCAAARLRAGPRPGAPGHPDRPGQPGPLDRGGGGCGRGPRPVRCAAARLRAGPRPGTPGHPDRPGQPRLLDRGGGGRGRGPRPVRCAAARASGCSARSTRTPWPPGPTWPAGPGRRGTRPRPATSTLRCCPSTSRSSARNTCTP